MLTVRLLRPNQLSAEQCSLWARIQEQQAVFASPYLTPDFTLAVAAVRDDVQVGILEQDGETVGFFPFQRGTLGIGKPVGGILSDCQGVVVRPEVPWDAQELVRGCGLRAWDFDHLLAAQQPFAPFHKVKFGSPQMDLSRGFEAYKAERRAAGSTLVSQLGTRSRRLEREVGPLRFEVHTTDPAILQRLLAWKSEQYQETGQVDLARVPWITALLQRIQATAGDGLAGLLTVLYAGNEITAAHLGMRSRTVWHYWFPAYDKRFGRYSPGLLLLYKMAEAAPSLGLHTIDLGAGELLYKQRFMGTSLPLASGRVEVPSLVSTLRGSWRAVESSMRSSKLAPLLRRPGRLVRRLQRWLSAR